MIAYQTAALIQTATN